MIHFECPSCVKVSSVPEHMAGERYTCRHCGSLLEIPVPEPGSASGGAEAFGTPVDSVVSSAPSKGEKTTCTRCGNFMPTPGGAAARQPICIACRDKSVIREFSMDRQNWTISGVINHSWEIFTADSNWVTLSMSFFVIYIINIFIGQVAQFGAGIAVAAMGPAGFAIFVPIQVVASIINFVFLAGLLKMCFVTLDGQKPDFSMAFSQFHKIVTVAGTWFAVAIVPGLLGGGLVAVGIALGAGNRGAGGEEVLAILALVTIPIFMTYGFFLGLPAYFFMGPLIAEREEIGVMATISESLELARGQRLSLFGLFFILSLLGGLGVFACCLGVFVSGSFVFLCVATTYRALQNNADAFVGL